MFRSPFATIIKPIYTMYALHALTVWDPICITNIFLLKIIAKTIS
jgi:hypothetical protein